MLKIALVVMTILSIASVSMAFDVLTWADETFGNVSEVGFLAGVGSGQDGVVEVLVGTILVGLTAMWAIRKFIKTVNRS